MALFGYKIVHQFERYAGLPVLVILIIVLGQAAPHMQSSMSPGGTATIASVLSFGGTVCGFALGWVSYAADCKWARRCCAEVSADPAPAPTDTVNFPANGSATKVFVSTYIGLNTPLIFVQCIGAGQFPRRASSSSSFGG